jgi:signal transduction histidine kinase
LAAEVKVVAQDLRALLVEDSADDADLLRRELKRAGFEAATERVASARAFSEALDHGKWDVVLADFTMPGFGGTAALEILKARGLDIPFIIVSGSMGEEVAVEVMKAGAHDYFSKSNTMRLGSAITREVREAEGRRRRLEEQRRLEAEKEKLLEELRAAVQSRDDFLSIASHELKTPLTGLKLQVQSLGRLCARAPDGSVATIAFDAKVRTMTHQLARLTRLIHSLLDVTRITSGDMTLSRESLALDELVAGVIAAAREAQEPTSADIVLEAERVVGVWDRLRVETIVSNLVSNAMKFGNGLPVRARVSRVGTMARLTIQDHGIGIVPEVRARIFEKFERAVPRQHYGGFGLGLWIARQLVIAHGGSIRVESEVGEGSTFTIELPLGGEA